MRVCCQTAPTGLCEDMTGVLKHAQVLCPCCQASSVNRPVLLMRTFSCGERLSRGAIEVMLLCQFMMLQT